MEPQQQGLSKQLLEVNSDLKRLPKIVVAAAIANLQCTFIKEV